ncbi:MAG: hypothetical protein R3B48_28255 [Kofleriaceae bacterium]
MTTLPPGCEPTDEFRTDVLELGDDLFPALFESARLEAVGNGRWGAVLVKPDTDGRIPLVRTTTCYRHPAQRFGPLHEHLAQQARAQASRSLAFNNALFEYYTNAYTKMGAHSDQALDLDEASTIAIFSCYKLPTGARPPRKLLIEAKDAGGRELAIPLANHGVVSFSLATNRRFRHRIVLDPLAKDPENPWLGITFRVSKTFVERRGEHLYFSGGAPLTLADEAQRTQFYQLRRRENTEVDFTYPSIPYTISESDLLPVGAAATPRE